VYPTKFAELYFLLLLGAVVVAGIDARAAQAFDAEAINARAPGHPWCVRERSGEYLFMPNLSALRWIAELS
jgi:hypothetical protein